MARLTAQGSIVQSNKSGQETQRSPLHLAEADKLLLSLCTDSKKRRNYRNARAEERVERELGKEGEGRERKEEGG